MASYTVDAGKLAAHAKTLVASTVDTVTFDDDLAAVEVYSDGSAAIYFTTDGTDPTVAGANCNFLPATTSERRVIVPSGGDTVVKLISAGTPTYHVIKAD